MSKQQKKRTPLPRWARICLSILKASWIPCMCLAALIAGLMIGYVYVGGQEASEVFKLSTWKHLVDLVFAD